MTKRKFVWGVVVAAALLIVAVATGVISKPDWLGGGGDRAAAQGQQSGPRAVAVDVGQAGKAKVPVLIEALGTVTTIASVAVKPRIDDEIVGIHFADGAFVKQGDLLVSLDTRALDAQLAQAEGNLARDQASLAGAERDLRRYTDLVAKGATPQLNVDNAKTQADTYRGAIQADAAAIDNLKVQLSYCAIRATISGRISQASVKIGNLARSADTVPIATINQMAPVYVTFLVPQRNLPEIRTALAESNAPVAAIIPGDTRRAAGIVSMVENAVDPSTGMATIRATMPNDDELLWPGTLVNAQLTLRTEESVVIPTAAVQVSQQGNFVYVVKDNVATVTPVKISQTLGEKTALQSGLAGGEIVVTNGHLLLNNGTRVTIRERKAGA
jgi:membrane fusion protein, multidrug efflux system